MIHIDADEALMAAQYWRTSPTVPADLLPELFALADEVERLRAAQTRVRDLCTDSQDNGALFLVDDVLRALDVGEKS